MNSEAHRHSNDGISVDAWVKEVKSTGCVLFYKSQGECCDKYSFLKNDDFAMVIMNQGQTEMFQKYGDDYICGRNPFGWTCMILILIQYNLNTRHKISETLNVNTLVATEEGWIVPSSSTQEFYQIEEKQIN